jgi:microcin C transport system substrate-binding protein
VRAAFVDIRSARLFRREVALLPSLGSLAQLDQYFRHRSYFEDLYSKDTPCTTAVYAFDKDAARKLLAAAGWVVNPKTGKLEKDGQPFTFAFLTRDEDTDRFLAVFDQALKDVGITMEPVRKDWASWQKDMDEFNFQMTWAAWSGDVKKDPEYQWASREADRPSGNNIAGLKLATVDELIAKQKTIFDLQARHELCRQADALIYREYPYILLWNINYERLCYWNKFGTPRTVLSKYGDAASAIYYWWLDPDAAAELGPYDVL